MKRLLLYYNSIMFLLIAALVCIIGRMIEVTPILAKQSTPEEDIIFGLDGIQLLALTVYISVFFLIFVVIFMRILEDKKTAIENFRAKQPTIDLATLADQEEEMKYYE